MTVFLKYDYRKFDFEPSEAFPRRFSVSRPIISIQLISGQNKQGCYAMIDSGADNCIFQASLGEIIGLTIESGKIDHFGGVSGKEQLTAYFHDIQIEVGGHRFNCWAGFSRDIEDLPCGILGQVGFFSLFDIRFDYNKKRIELKTRA